MREVRVPRVQAGMSPIGDHVADLSLGASIHHVHDTGDVNNVVLDDYTSCGAKPGAGSGVKIQISFCALKMRRMMIIRQ